MVLAALLACVHPAPPADVGHGRAIEIVPMLTSAETGEVRVASADPWMSVVAAHGFKPAASTRATALASQFRATRSAEQHVAFARADGVVLLLEVRPVFFSLMNGRYRWTAGVDVALLEPGHDPVRQSFDVPVFLEHQHEREAEVLAAATPAIARRLGRMLDDQAASTP